MEGDRWGGGIDGGDVLGGRAGHILGCSGVSIVFGSLKTRIVMEKEG